MRIVSFVLDTWARFCSLCRAVVGLRVSIVAAVVGIAIMRTDQMREVIATSIEDSGTGGSFDNLTFSMVAVCMAAFAIWLFGRSASLTATVGPGRSHECFLTMLPLAAACGYLAAMFGIFRLQMQVAHVPNNPFSEAIFFGSLGVFLLAVGFVVVAILRDFAGRRLDRWPTTWFFSDQDPPLHAPDDWNAFSVYVFSMAALQKFVRRSIHSRRPLNVLASSYRLSSPLARQQRLAAIAPPPSPGWIPATSPGWILPGVAQAVMLKPANAVQAIAPALLSVISPFLSFALLPVAMVTLVIPVMLVGCWVSFFFQIQETAEFVGAVAIVQLFVLMLLIVLTWWTRRSNVLIGTATIAVLLAAFDLNDTHHLRTLDGVPTGYPSLEEAFPQWLAARRDRAQFGRYPVYVVAARGGGIYAGYHAAMFLSRLQDACPGFAQHLFAISSVSGGSLGAGVFAALAKMHAVNGEADGCNGVRPDGGGTFETRTRNILAHDFLSPVASAALFPDVALQMLPACPIDDRRPVLCRWSFDRARALEVAFERAWGAADNPLERSFYKLWTPDGAVPALLLNTTTVETGSRLVILPFRRFTATGLEEATLFEEADDLDLRLSTAIGASARFPIITPAAWYRVRRGINAGVKLRLVDGGYFDNSGIATAIDVIELMRRAADSNHLPIDIRLIVLTGTPEPVLANYGFGELMSMVRTLLSARQEHGRQIEYYARLRAAMPSPYATVSLEYARLDTGSDRLPLGWQLRRLTARDRRERRHHCARPDGRRPQRSRCGHIAVTGIS